MVTQDKMAALYEPFQLKEREGMGGMKFKYIPSADVIDRMNKVFEGCWSSMVINEHASDEQVVVQVRVIVEDPVTGKSYQHDGYGSSNIARYSSGFKKGQIIDLGNAYKGAQSTAIRNACTRFGVGLYLDGKDYEVMGGESMPAPPAQEEAPPVITPEEVTMIKETADVPQSVPPTKESFPAFNIPAPPPSAPVEEAVEVVEEVAVPEPQRTMSAGPDMPSIPLPSIPTPPTSSGRSSSTKENKSNTPSIPSPTTTLSTNRAPKPSMTPAAPPTDMVKPTATTASNSQQSAVTDVQKAAMNGILSLKGVNYQEVCAEAFDREGIPTDNIPEKDDLDYKQAVAFIRWGTRLYKD